MEIKYKQCGDYLIPDLELREQRKIGHYGRLRKAYLEDHRPALFAELVLSERLYDHCAEIEDTVKARLELMIPQIAARNGIGESLKAANPLEWVAQMNLCKALAEEAVLAELIYSDLAVEGSV